MKLTIFTILIIVIVALLGHISYFYPTLASIMLLLLSGVVIFAGVKWLLNIMRVTGNSVAINDYMSSK